MGNVPGAKEIGRKVADAQEEVKFQHAWEIQGTALVVYQQTDKELAASRRARIAKYVAATKEVRKTKCFFFQNDVTARRKKIERRLF